ncbi:MAG: sugar ABC transporter ATP-binding protein [bacterium]|nr:sugar ABC transporter ATP-binding protein [bacterium]
MAGVSKRFLGTLAVNNVDFEARAGEVHALIGENGAGKSTLMKMLAGSFDDYSGQIFINRREVALHSPSMAIHHGIGMIYQELSLARPITIAENVLVGRLPQKYGFLVDRKAMIAETKACLERVGLDLDPMTQIEEISQHEAQLVEIAKVLWHKPSIVVMDEPTSALSREEVQRLFDIIKRLKEQGLAIIYISHHLPEVFQVADRVTVLRDGQKIGSHDIQDVSSEEVVNMMVGRAIEEMYHYEKREAEIEAFRTENLTRHGYFRDISFHVGQGEIVGIGGLSGAGRTELARVIAGADAVDQGRMYLENTPFAPRNMSEALASGVAYLTEDRKNQGLVLRLTVRENVLSALIPDHSHHFIYRQKQGEHLLAPLIKELQITPPDPEILTSNLSGGNQQKVLLAKWLATAPRLLILDEPTRGVDIGAKLIIHQTIEKLAEQGTAIVIISSDLPELVGLSDRIMIMRKGYFTQEMPRAECSEESVLLAVNEEQRSEYVG